MRSITLAILLLFTVLSCKKDDNPINNNNNPFLTPPIVDVSLNLNLPQFNPLKFPGNTVILNTQGIKGIVVYNLNNNLYTAFDLTDPNHLPNACSRMEISGVVATCPCDGEDGGNSYDLVTGQHQTDENAYPMHQYRISRDGDVITITN
ncbi:MAG: hypothetical protein AAF466_02295 [Bacteroidota bacterium]